MSEKNKIEIENSINFMQFLDLVTSKSLLHLSYDQIIHRFQLFNEFLNSKFFLLKKIFLNDFNFTQAERFKS
jgi:hypothetical protein